MLATSKCRTCRTVKAKGDVCPGCGAGMIAQRMRVRKGQPISFAKIHGLHEHASAVPRHLADGHYT